MGFFGSDYSGMGPGIYSAQHFIYLGISFLILLILYFVFRTKSLSARWGVIKVLTFLLIAWFIGLHIWNSFTGFFTAEGILPVHMCSYMIFFIPIAVFTKNKLAQHLVLGLGMPGAFVQMFMPVDYVFDFPLLTFRAMESMSTHAIIMIIGVLMLSLRLVKLDYKMLPKMSLSLIGLLSISLTVNLLVGGSSNYMFIMFAPAGTPFVAIQEVAGHAYLVAFVLILALIWAGMLLPSYFKEKSIKRKLVAQSST
jgi:hypothetical integral membrane protein (TIGR02206 family)